MVFREKSMSGFSKPKLNYPDKAMTAVDSSQQSSLTDLHHFWYFRIFRSELTWRRPLARVTAIIRPVHALSLLSAQPKTLTRNCVSLPNQSALLPQYYSQPWSCEQVNSELQRSELWSTPASTSGCAPLVPGGSRFGPQSKTKLTTNNCRVGYHVFRLPSF